MKFFTWAIVAINIYFGIYFFLNVVRVLRSSKYSKTATLVFAILFLCMGAGGLYFLLVNPNVSFAFWLGIGPWILSLVFLLINMMTGDYK
jgi:hypothetical protein